PQADGGEILLEIKETQRMPMVIAFQTWLNIDLEIQVDDSAEQPRDHIQNDDCIREACTSHCAKPVEERIRLRPGRRACCQCLMRDGAEQGHRDQTVQNENYCSHRLRPVLYENSASDANGSAEPGR